MKKNLLITLGCSFTEGVGCYDPALNPNKVLVYDLPPEAKKITIERFHERGWPNEVGRRLGFNKVLNLGLGGTANEGHLKVFVDKFIPQVRKLSKDYNLYLIWLMTIPNRIGLFTEDDITRIIPANGGTKYQYYDIEKAYLRDLKRINFAPIRDQVHLMKLSEFMFKALNINYVFASWSEDFIEVYNFYTSPNMLTPFPSFVPYSRKPNMISIACTHPNEEGYKFMADSMITSLKTYHPHFVHDKPSTFEWEWDGSTQYYPNKTNSVNSILKDSLI